eukprot:gene8148-9020_t
MKCILTLVVENTFSEMRSGATDMPMQLEFDYRLSRAIKERLKRQCATPFAYFTAPKSFYPHTFTSTNYKDLPKLRPPKPRALSARQVNEMRNWRAMYGQSVPPENALSQAPAVGAPQTNSRPETLYEQGQFVCVRGNRNVLFVIASLQEDALVGGKRVRASVYSQDPFNPILFTENAEKSVEVINILCVITNCHLKNGTLELEEGDLILLLEQLQTTNELITVMEAADLSAEEANADSEQPRTRSSRGRKRRFEEHFYYYE